LPQPTGPVEPWYRQATPWVVAALTLVIGAFGGFVVGQQTSGSPAAKAPVASSSASPSGDDAATPAPSSGTQPGASVQAKPPLGATDGMGIELGKDLQPGGEVADDAVTVDVVYDYLCPFCKQFEDTQGEALRELVAAGQVRLVIHPVAILDGASTTAYSTRAAGAAVAVAALAPAQFGAFDKALWANQPEEGGPGLSDEQLAELATQAGVPAKVVAQLADLGYQAWATEATSAMSQVQGFTGTPWVLMGYGDGSRYQVDWSNVDWTKAAANVKAGQAP
jgi:protein-disulfide isomerase